MVKRFGGSGPLRHLVKSYNVALASSDTGLCFAYILAVCVSITYLITASLEQNGCGSFHPNPVIVISHLHGSVLGLRQQIVLSV